MGISEWTVPSVCAVSNVTASGPFGKQWYGQEEIQTN